MNPTEKVNRSTILVLSKAIKKNQTIAFGKQAAIPAIISTGRPFHSLYSFKKIYILCFIINL